MKLSPGVFISSGRVSSPAAAAMLMHLEDGSYSVDMGFSMACQDAPIPPRIVFTVVDASTVMRTSSASSVLPTKKKAASSSMRPAKAIRWFAMICVFTIFLFD